MVVCDSSWFMVSHKPPQTNQKTKPVHASVFGLYPMRDGLPTSVILPLPLHCCHCHHHQAATAYQLGGRHMRERQWAWLPCQKPSVASVQVSAYQLGGQHMHRSNSRLSETGTSASEGGRGGGGGSRSSGKGQLAIPLCHCKMKHQGFGALLCFGAPVCFCKTGSPNQVINQIANQPVQFPLEKISGTKYEGKLSFSPLCTWGMLKEAKFSIWLVTLHKIGCHQCDAECCGKGEKSLQNKNANKLLAFWCAYKI